MAGLDQISLHKHNVGFLHIRINPFNTSSALIICNQESKDVQAQVKFVVLISVTTGSKIYKYTGNYNAPIILRVTVKFNIHVQFKNSQLK